MNAGRSRARDQRGERRDIAGIRLDPAMGARVDGRHVARGRPEHVEREVEERRPAVGLDRQAGGLVDHRARLRRVGDRRGRLRDRRQDRDVVEFLQRSGTPASLRRPTTEHDHRGTVEVRRRHRRHPVGDPGPGGQCSETRPSGEFRVRLRGERRRLLVPGVDHAHALVASGVVERPDVPPVQREHHVRAETRQSGNGLLPSVSFDQCHVI